MKGREIADAARRLLEGRSEGVLATISLRRAGFPFASLAPYALSATGAPLLLLSGLAQLVGGFGQAGWLPGADLAP